MLQPNQPPAFGRRIMEAQGGGSGGSGGATVGSGGNGGATVGSEVRRLHIIYFVCRKGRIEHPHLLRVHHVSRNGVHLRDIKRWLSEVRGKEMPESYAWSYKRRYKTGFVWQDLLDEDLITPISDNEYVLKGSEISSNTFDDDVSFFEKQGFTHKEAVKLEAMPEQQTSSRESPMDHHHVSTKSSPEIHEESPPFSSETSTLTDGLTKLEHEKIINTTELEEENQCEKRDNSPFYLNFFKNKRKNYFKVKKPSAIPDSSAPPKSKFSKSKSYSSNMFRNLITCGTVDIISDSGLMAPMRRRRKGSKVDMSTYKSTGEYKMGEIRGGETIGGSERFSRISWSKESPIAGRKSWDGGKGAKNEMNNSKPVLPAYKPVNGPNCSQCWKTFKPEKLHAHMKSCRGMKALANSKPPPAAANSSSLHRAASTDESPPRGSISRRFLIN